MIETMKSAVISALKPFNIALWAIIILILTLTGPFGTFETVSIGYRLIYWALVVLISALLGYQTAYVARELTQRRHPLLTDLLATFLMTLVFTPVNLWLTRVFVVTDLSDGPSLLEMAGYVAVVAFAILTGRRFIPGLEEDNYLPYSHDVNRPRLMRRLPDSAQARVLRISSQDHFVEVVTDRGSNRLRMRLVDAISEMDGVEGHWAHRSHWVAENAIRTVERVDGRIQLRLRNGDRVPVSRKYKPELEAAGVI